MLYLFLEQAGEPNGEAEAGMELTTLDLQEIVFGNTEGNKLFFCGLFTHSCLRELRLCRLPTAADRPVKLHYCD